MTDNLTLRQFVDKVIDEQLAKYNISGVQRDFFLEKMHAMVRPIIEFTACFNLLFPDENAQRAVAHDFMTLMHTQATAIMAASADARYSREVQSMIADVQSQYATRMTPIVSVHDPEAFQRALQQSTDETTS